MLNEGIEDKSFMNSKLFAFLAYFPFLCILPLLLKKDDPFVLTHGKQGLAIFVAEIGVFILSILVPILLKIGMFVLFVLSFMGMIAALRGKSIQLPVVTKVAEKISL